MKFNCFLPRAGVPAAPQTQESKLHGFPPMELSSEKVPLARWTPDFRGQSNACASLLFCMQATNNNVQNTFLAGGASIRGWIHEDLDQPNQVWTDFLPYSLKTATLEQISAPKTVLEPARTIIKLLAASNTIQQMHTDYYL